MNMVDIGVSLADYEQTFKDFVQANQLPAALFSVPDHYAIKCANQEDYSSTCDSMSGDVYDGIWELNLDNRFLASAQLAGRISIASCYFSWVEIMQPRPGKELEVGFVEHTEFFFPDFDKAEEILRQRSLDYEMQENPGHRWINIILDNSGREIKLNDKLLEDVVMQERKDGLLHRRVARA